MHADPPAQGVKIARRITANANHIEHILPQTPRPEIEEEFGAGVHDPRLLWSIGNLALAESAINQSLGNRPFSHKRTVYPRSQFLLTSSVAELPNIGHTAIDRAVASLKPFFAWNADAVRQRAEMMTRLAQEVWSITATKEAAGQTGPVLPSGAITNVVPVQSESAMQANFWSKRRGVLEGQLATEPTVTSLMRHYAETRSTDHFGFSGLRAAIACLYARPEGATQAEANNAADELGSRQRGYFNMLRQAKKWGHDVVTWDDPIRGRAYKLIYNANHSGPGEIEAPTGWSEMNVPSVPPGVSLVAWGN